MNRGVVIGAVGGLVAGVSLGALALASPSFALFSQNGASVAAPAAAQLALPAMAQEARWGSLPNLADLVEAATPSVVQINVRQSAKVRTMAGPQGNPFEGTPFERYLRRARPGRPDEAKCLTSAARARASSSRAAISSPTITSSKTPAR